MLSVRREPRLRVVAVLVVGVVMAGGGAQGETQTPAAPPRGAAPPPQPRRPGPTPPPTPPPPPPPVGRGAVGGKKRAEVLAALAGEPRRLPHPAPSGQARPGTSALAFPAYESDGTQFRVLFGFAG